MTAPFGIFHRIIITNITTDSKQLRITHTYEILQCFLKLRVKMSNFLGRTSPWILLHAVN